MSDILGMAPIDASTSLRCRTHSEISSVSASRSSTSVMSRQRLSESARRCSLVTDSSIDSTVSLSGPLVDRQCSEGAPPVGGNRMTF